MNNYELKITNDLPVVFVNKKSELTFIKDMHDNMLENWTFRTRTTCRCTAPHNRRDALLCINPYTQLLDLLVIRCKSCTKQKGGAQ